MMSTVGMMRLMRHRISRGKGLHGRRDGLGDGDETNMAFIDQESQEKGSRSGIVVDISPVVVGVQAVQLSDLLQVRTSQKSDFDS